MKRKTDSRVCIAIWLSRQLSLNTKLRIISTKVKSVLLHGCETWRSTKALHPFYGLIVCKSRLLVKMQSNFSRAGKLLVNKTIADVHTLSSESFFSINNFFRLMTKYNSFQSTQIPNSEYLRQVTLLTKIILTRNHWVSQKALRCRLHSKERCAHQMARQKRVLHKNPLSTPSNLPADRKCPLKLEDDFGPTNIRQKHGVIKR